jgi:hypothetical protein
MFKSTDPHFTLTTMSPVAPLESPFPHRVIVQDFSDKEFVSPVNRAAPMRLISLFYSSSPMSFLSGLRGLSCLLGWLLYSESDIRRFGSS